MTVTKLNAEIAFPSVCSSLIGHFPHQEGIKCKSVVKLKLKIEFSIFLLFQKDECVRNIEKSLFLHDDTTFD